MSKFCVKKPFFVLVAVIVVLIIGGVSLSKMQTDLLPDMEVPYLIVVTTEPGASPEKVETDVTKPMENALGVISGVKNVTSTSSENYGIVMLEFADDTDMDSALVKVSNALARIAIDSRTAICMISGSSPSVIETSAITEIVDNTAVINLMRMPVQMTSLSSSCPIDTSLITMTLSPSDVMDEKKDTYAAT